MLLYVYIKENKMIIYKVTNLINGKIYIGLTKQKLERRKKQHELHSLKKPLMVLHYAIKKYGKENFQWEIIKECNDFQELNRFERIFINQYNSTNIKIGYNRTAGGENPVMTEQTRKKMSKSQTRRYKDPVIKQQWGELMKNVYKNNPISEETKRKIGLKNKVKTKKYWKNLNPTKFLQRKKILIEIQKMAAKKRMKKIIQLDKNGCFIKEWESIAEASKELNINPTAISLVLRNKHKTSGGFLWEYKV
jgi:group I intron endonuclease